MNTYTTIMIERRKNKAVKDRKSLFSEYQTKKDCMILLTLGLTHSKPSDICDISVDDINFDTQTLTYRKNRIDKTIKLDSESMIEYYNYIHTWNLHGFLFTTFRDKEKTIQKQHQPSKYAISRMIRNLLRSNQ